MPFEHVFFIGGTPCSGKSTACDLLAAKHGLTAYHADEHYAAHLERAAEAHPTLRFLRSVSLLGAMTRPLPEMIRTALEANRELGALALEDVSKLGGGIVAEGMAFMPDVLATLEPRVKAAYLVPNAAFQREQYRKRDWAWALASKTPDPQAMFDNWMARDAANAKTVAAMAQGLDFPVLEVDGSLSLDETVAWLERQFRFGSV